MSIRLRGSCVYAFAFCLFCLFSLLSIPAYAQDPGEKAGCSACHDQGKKLAGSVHIKRECLECHPKHETYPHPEGVPKPACAQCHPDVARDYAGGVHGQAVKKGNQAAPDCAVCHGNVHEVASARSEAFRKNVPDTCGMCHNEIAEQFKLSVHGKAVAAGHRDAPVCTDCHGEHRIIAPKKRKLTGERGEHPQHLRALPQRCETGPALPDAAGPGDQF